MQNRAKKMVISRKVVSRENNGMVRFFFKIFKHLENISGHLTNQMDHLLKALTDLYNTKTVKTDAIVNSRGNVLIISAKSFLPWKVAFADSEG